jgi:hypothetical protein
MADSGRETQQRILSVAFRAKGRLERPLLLRGRRLVLSAPVIFSVAIGFQRLSRP